jgi:hypothetical protein
MSKVNDLTGQKFGRLTVIKRVENNIEGRAVWLCECNCDNKTQKLVTGKHLLNGSIVSCGCKKKERKRELTGQIFGRWKILKRDNSSKSSKWICECSCDLKTIRSVDEYSLISKVSQSCGCLNREISSQRAFNPIGHKFNKLIVEYKYGTDESGVSLWFCKCDCGGENIVTYGNLKSGNVKSCGCWKNEVIHQRECNTYIKLDNMYKCYTLQGEEFEIDECDYEKNKRLLLVYNF